MENSENKNKPRLENVEAQAAIRNNEELIKEAKNLIEKNFELIKDGIEILDAQTAYLEHIESNKEYIELEKAVTGESRPPKYSAEQIDESKKKIEILKADIQKLKVQIDDMTLGNIHLDVINDQWRELEKDLNVLVARVDKAQLN